MSTSDGARPRISRHEWRVWDKSRLALPRISFTVDLKSDSYKLIAEGPLRSPRLPEQGCFSERLSAWIYNNTPRSDWRRLLKLSHMEYVISQLSDNVSFITELSTNDGAQLDLYFERMDYEDAPHLMCVSFVDRNALDTLMDEGILRLIRSGAVAAALSLLHGSVFCVDALSSKVDTYYISPDVSEELRTVFQYSAYEDMLRDYVDTFVVNSDKPALIELCSAAEVCRRLSDRRLLSVQYKSMQGGRIHLARVSFARPDEPGQAPSSFVVCFTNAEEEELK